MTVRMFGILLLVLGIVSLLGSIFLLISSDSSLGVVLLVLSVVANVVGISLLGYRPKKKK